MPKDRVQPKKPDDKKVRAERFYEDDPDAFEVVKPKKEEKEETNE